jgi:crossover junction endodeoxyribonuclease RuvC
MIRIIGIDPGLANTGYGVIEIEKSRYRALAHGVITTDSGLPAGERLKIIYDALTEVVKEYKPREAGIEDLFFAKNAASAFPVAQAKGVALLLFQQRGIPVREYPPQAIKQAIVGRGRAEKGQVQELTKVLLGLDSVPKPDHASDALAAAICHYNNMNFTALVRGKQ